MGAKPAGPPPKPPTHFTLDVVMSPVTNDSATFELNGTKITLPLAFVPHGVTDGDKVKLQLHIIEGEIYPRPTKAQSRLRGLFGG